MIGRFDKDNFLSLCNRLTKKDKDLKKIITLYGHPPMWVRENTFATLILTILEQQVSLASAFAAYQKLKEKIQPSFVFSYVCEHILNKKYLSKIRKYDQYTKK